MEQGAERVRDLGPVLGAYHPVVAYNVRRLREISGLDEVSFHMSGHRGRDAGGAVWRAITPAARTSCGSAAPTMAGGATCSRASAIRPARDTYTLDDMSERTLRVLRRRRDIACVLVNPLQALHPNARAPADSLPGRQRRQAHFDRAAYADWLQRLREVCTNAISCSSSMKSSSAFGSRVGGAQEYFGVQARPRHLRQDARRRPSDRRGVRPPRI